MSGNDPLPTGTPIGDWGFCDHKGCTGRVPIERDSLLCDEHWEAEIRADERSNMDAYFASRSAEWEAKVRADQDDRECDHCTDLARLKVADLRAKVEALPSAYIVAGVWVDARPLDDDEWGDKPAVLRDAVLALFDGGSDE